MKAARHRFRDHDEAFAYPRAGLRNAKNGGLR
jgi:hypothetical protein